MWFKGGLHIHSNAVDGRLGKAELIDLYRKNDFDFIYTSEYFCYLTTLRLTRRP